MLSINVFDESTMRVGIKIAGRNKLDERESKTHLLNGVCQISKDQH